MCKSGALIVGLAVLPLYRIETGAEGLSYFSPIFPQGLSRWDVQGKDQGSGNGFPPALPAHDG
jgi:hypothetical protein